MMSLGSLFFPPEELDSRLSVTLTLVLTSVAYKFVVTDNLPKISYQVLLKIYKADNEIDVAGYLCTSCFLLHLFGSSRELIGLLIDLLLSEDSIISFI